VRCPMISHVMLGIMLMANPIGCTSVETPSDAAVGIEGLVSHKQTEGGFWAIEANDGRQFTPPNFPKAFEKDHLKVTIRGNVRPDVVGIHMYGPSIEILEIWKRESTMIALVWES